MPPPRAPLRIFLIALIAGAFFAQAPIGGLAGRSLLPAPGCGAPDDVTLSQHSIAQSVVFHACDSIAAGPDFMIEKLGDVTFRAGQTVVLGDGCSIESGGRLTIEVGPLGEIPANQPPSASFEARPALGPPPLNVSFDAAAANDSDGVVVLYEWDFGDDSGAFGTRVHHTYSAPGLYTIELTVTDDDGAETVASSAITVNDVPPVLLIDVFNEGDLEGWTVIDDGTNGPSSWSVQAGELVQDVEVFIDDNDRLGTYLYYNAGLTWDDYRLSFKMRSLDDDGIGAMFRYTDGNNYYRFLWDAERSERRLDKRVAGGFTTLFTEAVPYVSGAYYDVEILANGSLIEIRVGGNLVVSVIDSSHVLGTAALYNWANDASHYDDVLVEPPGGIGFAIATRRLSTAAVGVDYSHAVTTIGGAAPFTWSITRGALPSGLVLDPASGSVTGIPDEGGPFDITFDVVDAALQHAAKSVNLYVSAFVGTDFGHPYVQNPGPSAMTIVWWTHGDASGTLEYGIGSLTDSTASSPEAVMFAGPNPGDNVTRYKHEVELSGLLPGMPYLYRVSQGGDTFDSAFDTAPSEMLTPIRVLVWADTETELASHGTLGSGAPSTAMDQNEGIMAGVLAASNIDPDLILIAGDIVEQGGRLEDWDELFRKVNDRTSSFYGATGPLASRIPILAAAGNHDYYGFGYNQPNSESYGISKFTTHFANAPNTASTLIVDSAWPSEIDPAIRAAQNERYYAVKYGPATFIAIDVNNQSPEDSMFDTNWSMVGEEDTGGGNAPDWLPQSRQHQWLEEQLAKAQVESLFTFVFWHHSPFSGGGHNLPPVIDGLSGVPTRLLDKLLHQYRVTAVFTGHEELVEMSETRGVAADGGDPNHTIRYFIPGSM